MHKGIVCWKNSGLLYWRPILTTLYLGEMYDRSQRLSALYLRRLWLYL